MITLELDTNAKTLHVVASSQYTIGPIYIDTQDTFNCEEEPSTRAACIEIEGTEGEDNMYHIDTVIDLTSLSLGSTILTADVHTSLFFVFISCNEGMEYLMDIVYDNNYLMRYVFNILYRSLIISNCCENISNVPIDNLLLYYAFILAVSCRDKVFFWKKLYTGHTNELNSINCNCHGT